MTGDAMTPQATPPGGNTEPASATRPQSPEATLLTLSCSLLGISFVCAARACALPPTAASMLLLLTAGLLGFCVGSTSRMNHPLHFVSSLMMVGVILDLVGVLVWLSVLEASWHGIVGVILAVFGFGLGMVVVSKIAPWRVMLHYGGRAIDANNAPTWRYPAPLMGLISCTMFFVQIPVLAAAPCLVAAALGSGSERFATLVVLCVIVFCPAVGTAAGAYGLMKQGFRLPALGGVALNAPILIGGVSLVVMDNSTSNDILWLWALPTIISIAVALVHILSMVMKRKGRTCELHS
jgi:hypothetical protein